LGASPALQHDYPELGVFMTTSAAEEGERFLHILNLDGFDKTLHLADNDRPLFDGHPIVLRSRQGLMLPLDVSFGDRRIVYSTAEILEVSADAITFRLTQGQDVIAIESDRSIAPGLDYVVDDHKPDRHASSLASPPAWTIS
jgi:beta-galactosidase